MHKTLRALGIWCAAVAGLWAATAAAQDRAYLQVEARPTQAQARVAAERYAAVFDGVVGYGLGTGWYAIALGPYPDRAAAEVARRSLTAAGRVPADAFVVEAARTAARIWPEPGAPAADPAAPPPGAAPGDPPRQASGDAPEETLAQAQRAEAALDRAARADVQTALAWFGHYALAVDASFGPGTRSAMAAWQEAEGHPPTGVLTTPQRAALLERWQAERAAFGFASWRGAEAGIEVTLPLALVAFDRVEAPFVRFAPAADSGVELLLISQQGGPAALAALAEGLQLLEAIPQGAEVARSPDSVTLTAADDRVQAHAHVMHDAGRLRGFVLSWPAGAALDMGRAVTVMRDSLRTVGPPLPADAGGPASLVPGAELVAGLDLRQPARRLSGFFVDGAGRVATSDALADGCARLTIQGRHPASVALRDPDLGVAVLLPEPTLAPPARARFAASLPALRAEVLLAGYALPEMTAPVLTPGRVLALEGWDGAAGQRRLALAAEPGEVGGPVLDRFGAVVGLLLPPAAPGGRVLPDDVAFVAGAGPMLALLRGAGLTPDQAEGGEDPLDLPALARLATGLTVQVECWD